MSSNRGGTSSRIDLQDPELVWRDPNAKSVSFFCRRKPVRIDQRLIEELKGLAKSLGNKNVRICLHESPDASFHEMIILEHPTKYYRPHKHLMKGESYHVINGSMAVFVFNNDGEIVDACRLRADGCLVYRVGANMYHAVMPLSARVIYHESKPGPFLGDRDSIFAEWAPDGGDPRAVEQFQQRLLESLSSEQPVGEDK